MARGRIAKKKITPIMRLGKIQFSELKDAPYNPRTIDETSLRGLEGSLEKYGYLQPIVWNKRTGHVVGGHQRQKVLLANGVNPKDLIEVVLVDLPLEEEKALNIALNNEFIQGKWDYKKLAEILKELSPMLQDSTFLPRFEIDPLILGSWQIPITGELPGREAIDTQIECTCPVCGNVFIIKK